MTAPACAGCGHHSHINVCVAIDPDLDPYATPPCGCGYDHRLSGETAARIADAMDDPEWSERNRSLTIEDLAN